MNPSPNDVVVELVWALQPSFVVELGTGDGLTAASVMEVLGPSSRLTTINWPNPPSGDAPHKYLGKWKDDERLEVVLGDTRNEYRRFSDRTIDLLYIDSTHTMECAMEEWYVYRPKLVYGAVVVVDDLNHGDMREFWGRLSYPKVELRGETVGVLRYVTY